MSDARPIAAPVRIAPAHALADGEAARVDLDGEPIAIFRVGEELFAVAGDCLHMGASLAEGTVADCVVTCPEHRWRYALRDGARIDRVGTPLRTYEIAVRDGWIVLGGVPATTDDQGTSHDRDP